MIRLRLKEQSIRMEEDHQRRYEDSEVEISNSRSNEKKYNVREML